MSERTSYEAGVPSWVDLMTPSRADAKRFYGALFGWTFQDELDGDTIIYTQCLSNGKNVCGLGEMGPEMQASGMPPVWTTYVATDDVDAASKRVEQAGGTVMMPAMQVMDAGRMAMYVDAIGAVFGVWEAGKHTGAQLVNEPVGFSWNQLNARDTDGAIAFYRDVFGWTASSVTEPMPYTEWQLDGRTIGGMMPMPPEIPAEAPSHWLTYFAVADTNATVEQAQKLGATVMVPPFDIPMGRISVFADPAGATLAVIGLNDTHER
jgi:predicted enzyme related to lactoylglutathione lyase